MNRVGGRPSGRSPLTHTQRGRCSMVTMRVVRDHGRFRRWQVVQLPIKVALNASWSGWAEYMPIGWKPSDMRETR